MSFLKKKRTLTTTFEKHIIIDKKAAKRLINANTISSLDLKSVDTKKISDVNELRTWFSDIKNKKDGYEMNRINNRGRATGKTTRLLYASEFNNIPILVRDKTHADMLLMTAHQLSLKIPNPITVGELVELKYKGLPELRDRKIYCDDMELVFPELIKRISGLDVTDSTMCVPFGSGENNETLD